jgi:hypothetical protein
MFKFVVLSPLLGLFRFAYKQPRIRQIVLIFLPRRLARFLRQYLIAYLSHESRPQNTVNTGLIAPSRLEVVQHDLIGNHANNR